MRYISLSIRASDAHHPAEDASSTNPAGTILAVADGVTRSAGNGPYPIPSPARKAADLFCETVQTVLADIAAPTDQQLLDAFAAANKAIAAYNQAAFANTNYYETDLAGAVAALAVIHGSEVACCYLGDSGVAILDASGTIRWQSPDDVATAVANFPPRLQTQLPKERQIQIRRDFRNKPDKPYGYGVLTGEPDALAFVKIERTTLAPTETVVVFSDGALPLLEDPKGRQALTQLSAKRVAERRPHSHMSSELTLIAAKLS